jgi:hypothetical protein
MAGGTVTISGGNVIHTFTSTGYLAPIKYANNSLRFRSSASAYLNRTFTSVGTRTTFTYSVWLKRGTLGSFQRFFSDSSNNSYLRFSTGDALDWNFYNGSTSYTITSSQVFRDPAAWYHIMVAVDTTQATSSNRVKFYVNGSQITAFSSASYPAQNNTSNFDNNTAHYISSYSGSAEFFDGYLTEINFIDGQALTPNSFGTFNSYGVWQPITYGGSYGTNGFYLPFPNSATGSTLSASYLVVAGGAGGAGEVATGHGTGGGGGAGGLLTGSSTLYLSQSYVVTVGAGGTGGSARSTSATNGSNSVFNAITATGGGRGAGGADGTSNTGGSGGGGGGGPSSTGSAGTSGQGNAGGNAGGNGTQNNASGGGGGGAGASGSNGSGNTGGNGGNGSASSISGSSVTYAGGGGGGSDNNGTAGSGGTGGGGAGAGSGTATAGTANRGGGGGGAGASASTSGTGGAGGSGIVIVSYAGPQRYTGGTVTSSGGNTIHTFTSSGVLTSIFNDFSPNGNNWTGNNFDVTNTTATTYDSMTDVPTLTSSTVANYCVLNPLDKGTNLTVLDGNLKASVGTTASNTSWVRSSIGVTSGKWYVEFAGLTTANSWMVGICQAQTDLNSAVYSASTSWLYNAANGNVNSAGSIVQTNATWTSSDTIGIVFDADSGTLQWYKNNVAQGTALTGLTSGPYFFVVGYASSATAWTAAINFGQQPFKYTPPSGFVALNTYNM